MTEKSASSFTIHKREIKKLLPHRWPFLLVNSDVLIEGEKATMGKYFGFFWWLICKLGHFPLMPIVPGVVFIELCAQISALIIVTLNKAPHGIPTFRSTKATFIKPFKPLCMAYVEVTLRKETLGLFQFDCKVHNHAGEVLSKIEIVGTSVPAEIFSKESAKVDVNTAKTV